mmetsp:Transcript_7697/g.19727  ORF Transcript_7697/g.19727 Transcript_7697/m.19727 type:complete len:241 (-) Transcript_7697:346-1068(-)
MARRLPSEVGECLGGVAPLVAPTPVVVVLYILPGDEALHPADGAVGPVRELDDVGGDEVDPLGHPLLVELGGPLPGLGLHPDVIEVLACGSTPRLGHLGNEPRLLPRGREVSHVVRSAHRTLCEGGPLDDDVDQGAAPLPGHRVVLVLYRLLRLCDIKVIRVNVFRQLKLWHGESLLVREELLDSRPHSDLSEGHEPRRKHELAAGEVPLALPVRRLPYPLEHVLGQPRPREEGHRRGPV